MYYKKPNKIKIEADGFAILPKTGVGGNPNEYFDMLKEIIEITAFQLDGKPFYKITGHVNQDSLEIPISVHDQDSLDIKMNVFIDAVAWTINKVVVALNSEYVFTFETTYTEVDGISVPEKSEFKLGIQGMSRWTTRNLFGGPSEDRKDFEAIAKGVGFDPEKDEFAGTVVMEFSKYKVNQGLDDSIFE